jgi:mediator of RNA polymerase II transcription subunit 7
MADQQQGNALASAFPSPPPFYQHFTEENLARVAVLRAGKDSDSSQKDGSLTKVDLPTELQYLQPPDPPAEGTYRSFGDLYNVCRVLS